MAFEQKDNSGSLFKNDRKAMDSHADYTGSIKVDGRDYWLNAWLKDGAKGKYMSVSVRPKETRAAPTPSRKNELDDDLPF
jgi:hypothetical protein